MLGWFGKKKSEPETSPGGSTIHRYPAASWSPSRTGSIDESTAKLAETRNQVYTRLFGEPKDVFKETLPRIPRVDVLTYYRQGKQGEVCTLVTSGMSDMEMNVPAGADAPRRVELIFYCSEPQQEYRETLQWLAHFPHDQQTWIGWGHTIPNGTPPAPFWGSSILDTILFLKPIVKLDQTLPQELFLDGQPVSFLWVVPLTSPECNLKLKKGTDAVLDVLQQHRHPYVFDPARKSYV